MWTISLTRNCLPPIWRFFPPSPASPPISPIYRAGTEDMDTMAAMWDGTQSRPIVQPHEAVLGSLTIEEIRYTAPGGVPVLGFLC